MNLLEAAFGADPGAQVWSAATGTARERWLAAVVLGGQGHYAAATSLLGALRREPDPVLASLAASTLASHRRQLGGHAAARLLDGEALARLAGLRPELTDPNAVDSGGALVDALVGLAADAIGTGQLALARRLHAAAAAAFDGLPVRAPGRWRPLTRLHWVAAEIELACGRHAESVPLAERALAAATGAGALRHVAKSRLVLAAGLANLPGAAEKGRAEALLECDLHHNEGLSLHPLVWPCALLLGHLRPDGAARWHERAKGVLSCVLLHADPVGRRLAEASVWVP
ncbi:hypothetical protein GCM10010174_08870 [Kutzneria viridogrisea]|uniref:Uncharacterized protein n=1 Tax=Kutzneria viridogrisea TaxID=47990 RepID=A0ABR6BX31_9PSEU|nr:hypothetical protein [Kutzneria viridogrisea]